MDSATKEEFGKVHKAVSKLGRNVDKLTNIIEKGFSAVMEDAAETRKEFLDHFVSIEGRLLNIEQEVRSIRHDLEILKEKVGNIEGYGKEIDHALERVARIEKHLGLTKASSNGI